MTARIDLKGQRFSNLTVVDFSHSKNGAVWRCTCDCGTDNVLVRSGHLRSGSVQSCGCVRVSFYEKNLDGKKNRTHGMSRHPLDGVFDNMLKRCYSKNNKRYQHYGGRGIRICKQWRDDRSTFYKWALENGWRKGLTIDRVDNDGDYCPENCRFVDSFVQMNNTSRNRFLTWNGKTQTVSQWADEIGVRKQALQHRVTRGWPVERIFTQPFRTRNYG